MTRIGYGLLFLLISIALFILSLVSGRYREDVVEMRSSPRVFLVSPFNSRLSRMKAGAEKTLLLKALYENLESVEYSGPDVVTVDGEEIKKVLEIFKIEFGIELALDNDEFVFRGLRLELVR